MADKTGASIAATAEIILPVPADQLGDPGLEEALWMRWSAWKGAASVNSVRAMATGMRIFASWCRRDGWPVVPAPAAAVKLFIDELAQKGLSPATIDNRRAAISLLHRLAGEPDPTSDEMVRWAIKQARKDWRKPQRQAHGLRALGDVTEPERAERQPVSVEGMIGAALTEAKSLLSDLDKPSTRRRYLVLMRDAAMLSVAYDAGLRGEEVTRVTASLVERDPDGEGVLTLPFSKTDQEGRGASCHLSLVTMELLDRWSDAAEAEGYTPGPYFVGIQSGGRINPAPMKPPAVTDSYRRLASLVLSNSGTPEKEVSEIAAAISSHSPRVGACQDMLAFGEDLAGVMQALRWQSPAMPVRYGRKLAVRSGSGARIHRRLRSRR